jgi:uncharacterized membrane protein YciS (DUF1049 family)
MVRTLCIAILFVAGVALGALLLCVLALRVLLSTIVALSGIRRRMTRGARVLNW